MEAQSQVRPSQEGLCGQWATGMAVVCAVGTGAGSHGPGGGQTWARRGRPPRSVLLRPPRLAPWKTRVVFSRPGVIPSVALLLLHLSH